ncbi:MAG: threonine--tRNA ligase [Patescibacteria group bacterium]
MSNSNQNQEQLHKLRHSYAHILAAAVGELYPNVKFAIGPVIENGFYYDFDFGEEKFNEEDLAQVEKKMKHLIKQNPDFKNYTMEAEEAMAKEEQKGQIYKQELIRDLKQEGESQVSYYQVGNFEDLCRGPHVESAKELNPKAFKLTSVAGAYWKGDEKNKMLTRIYGAAFRSPEELNEYLKMMEEAKKRDHRKLGRKLDLFHIDEKVGLGLPLWHPNGAILWRVIEDFWHREHLKNGYELVRSPHIGNRILWETSGHWGFYSDNMYPPLEVGQTLEDRQAEKRVEESEEYLLKPMNCPFHVQIYKDGQRSYRDMPVRWAECGTVYRYEKKGELSGLTRVRGFTQDDAHIVCRKDQVEEELKKVIDFILFIFNSFGFDTNLINVYLSLRDPENKEKYSGSDDGWDFTEKVLKKVAEEKELNFTEEKGEAAFYGPKLDFKLKDVLGREWQCSTLQFDFNLPERFDMDFVNNKGEKERPYMLHRALFGSFERFIALLIEHYAGAFPVWLSPVQVKILSVGEAHREYCRKLAEELRQKNIRTDIDIEDATINYKIRKATKEKAPYILVVGDKEMNSGVLTVRDRGSEQTREVDKEDFIKEIKE